MLASLAGFHPGGFGRTAGVSPAAWRNAHELPFLPCEWRPRSVFLALSSAVAAVLLPCPNAFVAVSF